MTEKNEYRALLCRTSDLTPAQRLVIMLYALSHSDRGGVVRETGQALAEQLGMTPTVFSRIRKQLVQAGWLEESEKFAHITYFRLSPQALGEQTVVPMRRAI
ncbi:helix-turn-helix domain-containing protein [Streptacidiphilus rugosus]|uniref:helix-turn-helix domain-containing protein n=1 Tax=Streptacidiphilus rugosus TaxID=405783 RepID=UPI0005600E5B|nr:helix-turn-helix domain-containing protein [Streptacidiphilus rugosus]